MRVLVLFAHPALEKSRVHRRLLARVPRQPGITVNDLYERYPDGDVDVAREQGLLEAHDAIVLQFPFYWYSTPPLVKQWEDLVLEHGWAYGTDGRRLEGKYWINAVSSGGQAQAYHAEGYNRFTIRELLVPLEQTARLCRMRYLAPFVVHGTHAMDDAAIARAADEYRRFLLLLAEDRLDLAHAATLPSINVLVRAADAATDQPAEAR